MKTTRTLRRGLAAAAAAGTVLLAAACGSSAAAGGSSASAGDGSGYTLRVGFISNTAILVGRRASPCTTARSSRA